MKTIANITLNRRVIITGAYEALLPVFSVITNSKEYKDLPDPIKLVLDKKYNIFQYTTNFKPSEKVNTFRLQIVEIRIMSQV